MSLVLLSPLALLLPLTPAPHHLNRRALLAQGGSAAAALALAPLAAQADVRGANQDIPKDKNGVNKLLKSLGLAEMQVPGGFSPLVQYIGTAPPANIDGFKAKERAFPSTVRQSQLLNSATAVVDARASPRWSPPTRVRPRSCWCASFSPTVG